MLAVDHFIRGHFAAEFGNLFLPQVIGMIGQGFGNFYGLGPFFFLLVNFQQALQRFIIAHRAAQLEKNVFRAVEQAGLEVILSQFGQGMQALRRTQAFTFDQILVHADRTVRLTTAAEQAAQREVHLDGFGINPRRLDEGFDSLVRLLIEQEIEALEIRAWQRARLVNQLLDVNPRGDPAEDEKSRQGQQPPKFYFH